jgi:translation initiation factor 1 (eIF-1/SUI1)
VSNKKQTVVTGLELWQIDYDEIVPFLSVKCAGSATLHEAGAGAKKDAMEIQIQGEHIETITEILVKKYKIPIKYIESINNIESKKKKK